MKNQFILIRNFSCVVALALLTTFSLSAVASLDLDQLSYKVTQESRKTANVRLDALSILEHGYNLSVDVPVARGWTFGPSLFHFPQSYSLYNFTADGIGFVSLKFFNGKAFRSGWYAGPMAYYIQGENFVSELSNTPSGFQFGARGGYQWMWNRFNIQAGVTSAVLTVGHASGVLQGDVNLGIVL